MLPDLQNIDLKDALYDVSNALINERTKCLYWMKKYNFERNQRHILSLEIDECRIKAKHSLSELIEKGGEVNEVTLLYKSELSRLQILESALRIEKENIMRLMTQVNLERCE
ncbi:unnamed protein product [Lepeophtheirus salmonis]|nr:unnamed protein product [Lepeophtheirus salmonis]CAF2889631.1 unnamed protein product [Lepeophtheirus salmonis]